MRGLPRAELVLALAALGAGAAPAAAVSDLAAIERQLGHEAELKESLEAFPLLTQEEFDGLPTADLRRDQFVWRWAEHYRQARLGRHPFITSIAPETDATRRENLESFDPMQMRSGMRTEGATRETDEHLPKVLTPCAEAHEAVHERDLHAEARRFSRARAEQMLADGRLMDDTGYVRAERHLGREGALDAFASALFQNDLEGNRAYVARQRAAGYAGPVRMLDGPLRDANVHFGHVDRRISPAENFTRVRRLAAYELRAYTESSRCLEAAAERLRAAAPDGGQE